MVLARQGGVFDKWTAPILIIRSRIGLEVRIRKGMVALCADEEQDHTRFAALRLVLEKD